MRGVALRLSALVLAFALAAPSAQADSWTELEQTSIEAYGRAWFEALRTRDASKLDSYVMTPDVAGQWLETLRAAMGKDRGEELAQELERLGGWGQLVRRAGEVVRSMVEEAATDPRIEWDQAVLDSVAGVRGTGAFDGGVLSTFSVTLQVRVGAERMRFVTSAWATPGGPRLSPLGSHAKLLDAPPRGAVLPGGPRQAVRVQFDLAVARRAGLGGAEATPAMMGEAVATHIRAYLKRAALIGYAVDVVGPGLLDVVGPSGKRGDALREALASGGPVGEPTQLRVEVQPLQTLLQHRLGDGPDEDARYPRHRPDAAPWQGAGEAFPATPAGLSAYLESEVGRWVASRDSGTPYVPTDARYELVFGPKVDDWSVSNAHLLEAEAHRLVFDRSTIRMAWPEISPFSGQWIVSYEMTPEGSVRLGEWSGRNVGLAGAILVDGRWTMAPRINGRLTDTVQISLGSGEADELEAEARQIVRDMLGPISPVPLTLRSIEPR